MSSGSKAAQTTIALLLILVLFIPLYRQAQAQASVVNFTPADRFFIPKSNASVAFAANGSYASATLANDTWVFERLSVNNSRSTGTLKLSAQDSNVTVFAYTANLFGRNAAFCGLSVEGSGKATVNLGVNATAPTNPAEWSVARPDNVFLGEGDGWRLLADNTVVVEGLTGYFSIMYFSFNMPSASSAGPFYMQHSIAIITAVALAATVTAAVVVTRRRR